MATPAKDDAPPARKKQRRDSAGNSDAAEQVSSSGGISNVATSIVGGPQGVINFEYQSDSDAEVLPVLSTVPQPFKESTAHP